jgi:hypothetical protein
MTWQANVALHVGRRTNLSQLKESKDENNHGGGAQRDEGVSTKVEKRLGLGTF